MTKSAVVLLILFLGLRSDAQSVLDKCLQDIKVEQEYKLRILREGRPFRGLDSLIKELNEDTSTGNTFARIHKEALNGLYGCQFPNESFLTVEGRRQVLDSLKSDFVVLNFNDLDDDGSVRQLEDLKRLKIEKGNHLAVISFFSKSKKDIQHLVDKYRNEIIFVSDGDVYTKKYVDTFGYPMIWVLDKNRIIKYVNVGSSGEIGALFFDLNQKIF